MYGWMICFTPYGNFLSYQFIQIGRAWRHSLLIHSLPMIPPRFREVDIVLHMQEDHDGYLVPILAEADEQKP